MPFSSLIASFVALVDHMLCYISNPDVPPRAQGNPRKTPLVLLVLVLLLVLLVLTVLVLGMITLGALCEGATAAGRVAGVDIPGDRGCRCRDRLEPEFSRADDDDDREDDERDEEEWRPGI